MRKPNNRRFGFWGTLAFLATLAYPLSFFPACWVYTRLDGWRFQSSAGHCIAWGYRPLVLGLSESPSEVQLAVSRLIELGAADTQTWFLNDSDLRGLVLIRPGYTFTLVSYRTVSTPRFGCLPLRPSNPYPS